MRKRFSTAAAFVVATMLAGCIYESALEKKPTESVEDRYLGNWRKADASGGRLLIRKFDARQYAIVMEDEKSLECYRAFTTAFEGLRLASVQTLAPDGPAAGKWAIFACRLDEADRLGIRMLNNKVILPDLTSPEALRRAIRENRQRPDLFLEEIVYVREPPAKAATR